MHLAAEHYLRAIVQVHLSETEKTNYYISKGKEQG
jgi:hypothetical protein